MKTTKTLLITLLAALAVVLQVCAWPPAAATQAEVLEGLNTYKYITPAALAVKLSNVVTNGNVGSSSGLSFTNPSNGRYLTVSAREIYARVTNSAGAMNLGVDSGGGKYHGALDLISDNGYTISLRSSDGGAEIPGILNVGSISGSGSGLTNINAPSLRVTNAPVNGYALRYTNGNLYWAP